MEEEREREVGKEKGRRGGRGEGKEEEGDEGRSGGEREINLYNYSRVPCIVITVSRYEVYISITEITERVLKVNKNLYLFLTSQ